MAYSNAPVGITLPQKKTTYPMRSPEERAREASRVEEPYSSWDLSTAATRVLEGFPTHVLHTVQRRLDLSYEELAHVVRIPLRTLARRRKEERLPPDESERVYRVARLAEIAARVLGGREEAATWMKEPNYALNEQAPLEVARTEPGAALVERVLGQIEHGIPV